jgi:dinuclear metal center YbgI/SA1388 family protein
MTVHEITASLEKWAPLAYAEDFDNVGLLVGNRQQRVSKALITHDAIEPVVDEAIREKCELIICFHPIIFQGLKRITNTSYVSRAITKAIKHDIAIYAIHTALDVQLDGVNKGLADALGLEQRTVVLPKQGSLLKLSTYVPEAHLIPLQAALFAAGAGALGAYDECSFTNAGTGSFRPLEGSDPYVGEQGNRHVEGEICLQVVLPKHRKKAVVEVLLQTHPYETVAYELFPIENVRTDLGMGCVGMLEEALDEHAFLSKLKAVLGTPSLRHSRLTGKKIARVALLGGAGSFAIEAAKRQGADAFVTADLKYHDFFKGEKDCLLVDVGHYESEQFTKNTIIEYLSKNFPSFAFISSQTVTNPVYYF